MNLVSNCDNSAGPFKCKLEDKSCLVVFDIGLQCATRVSVTVLAHSWSREPYLGNVLSAWL